MQTITVRQFIDQGNRPLPGTRVYIKTHAGLEEVDYVKWPETNPWVHCPRSNGGFGLSYCVSWSDPLQVEATNV